MDIKEISDKVDVIAENIPKVYEQFYEDFATKQEVETKLKEVAVQPDWNQNDPTQPDYVKNRTHYSYKLEDIAWNGDEIGHEVVTPWDENERFVKVSNRIFNSEAVIGGHFCLSDNTDYKITLDGVENFPSGSFLAGIMLVVLSEEVNAELNVPSGTFSNGVYFLTYTGEPFVTKLVFPDATKKLDEKYLPELAPVAKTGDYADLSNTPIVDQAYASQSENAQSGKALKQAIDTCIPRVTGDPALYRGYLTAFMNSDGTPSKFAWSSYGNSFDEITIGNTRLTETQLQKLLALINE